MVRRGLTLDPGDASMMRGESPWDDIVVAVHERLKAANRRKASRHREKHLLEERARVRKAMSLHRAKKKREKETAGG